MSGGMLMGAVGDTVANTVGHAGATPYDLAFLSSTAVEIMAVATVLTLLALGLIRSVFRSDAVSSAWLRLHRGFDLLKLSKMLIPLACLSATVWVWNLIQGA